MVIQRMEYEVSEHASGVLGSSWCPHVAWSELPNVWGAHGSCSRCWRTPSLSPRSSTTTECAALSFVLCKFEFMKIKICRVCYNTKALQKKHLREIAISMVRLAPNVDIPMSRRSLSVSVMKTLRSTSCSLKTSESYKNKTAEIK